MAQEKLFENRLKAYLKNKSWTLKTFSDGIQRTGVPDLLICHEGRFIGAELKSDVGVLSTLQKYNLSEINRFGGIGIMLRPKDFQGFVDYLEGRGSEEWLEAHRVKEWEE